MGPRSRSPMRLVALAAVIVAVLLAPAGAGAAQTEVDSVSIVDYSRVATAQDLTFNDFSGPSGVFGDASPPSLAAPGSTSPALHFAWDFTPPDAEGFAGLFHRFLGP